MNKKVRRVDIIPHARTVVSRLCCENYRFSTKLLYAVAYVPAAAFRPRWHRPEGTMVAAETCVSTLRRSVAGCWVSGLYQRSTPLARSARLPQLHARSRIHCHAVTRLHKHYTPSLCISQWGLKIYYSSTKV